MYVASRNKNLEIVKPLCAKADLNGRTQNRFHNHKGEGYVNLRDHDDRNGAAGASEIS